MSSNIYYTKIYFATLCGLVVGLFAEAQEHKQDTIKNQLQDTVINQLYLENIGYAKQPAWKISGAISSVKGEKLEKSFTSNLATTLYGRIPGLTVMQGGTEPGLESPDLLGRGIGTYASGRKLLILVDGYESNFEQLTPEEIESITLLKDAGATAIYGSRGANGVLLVTTKRGKIAPLSVSFSTQVGFNNAAYLPDFLESYDYARLYNEALINDGGAAFYSDDDLEAYRTGSDPYFHPNVNWYDKVLRNSAPIENYNLNFSGGTQKVRYFGLLNFISNNTLLIKSGDMSENSKNSTYNRYNYRTNVDVNLTKALTASLTLGGSIEDKTNPVGNNTWSLFNSIAKIAPNAFPVHNPDSTYGGNSLNTNPLGNMLETGQYTSNGRTLQSTLKLTLDLDMLTKGLSMSGAVSLNNFFKNYSSKTREYERYSIADNGSGEAVYTKFGQETSLRGSEGESEQWRNVVAQGYLDYNRTFGVHDIDAMMMISSDSYTVNGQEHPFNHLGIGGRLNYTHSQKYIGEFSFSYMGSENFPKGDQFGFFPALSLGWIISKEDFLKESRVLNYLKIRGSYGLVGNDDLGAGRFMFDQVYSYPPAYYFGTANSSSSSLEEGRLANPMITWEKDKKLNIGLDMTLIKKLQFTLDVFYNDRYDILATPYQTIPDVFGINLPLLNEGNVINKGFETTLSYERVYSTDFKLSFVASAWYTKNKIINMSEPLRQYNYQNRTGKSIGQPFGLEAIGFFKDADDIAANPRQTFTEVIPGDIKYKDQNGDGIIDVSDNIAIGNSAIPELTLSFNPGFTFKEFDFMMLFQAVTGRSTYLGGLEFQAFQNNGKISSLALDRWTPETAQSATYPRLSSKDNLNNFRYSSFWQKNGNFIKLRSVELGYTFNASLVQRVGINSTRIFLNGTNLFSWDHLKDSDPETQSGYVGYPSIRTFSMGIKIGF